MSVRGLLFAYGVLLAGSGDASMWMDGGLAARCTLLPSLKHHNLPRGLLAANSPFTLI